MDSDSNSSSLHSLELSIFIVFLILLVALLITVSIYFLLRRRALRRSSGDCAICLSPFEPQDKLRHLPLCCHAFHARCIDTWLVSNQTCPLCRSPLVASDDAVPVPVTAAPASEASLAEDVGHDGSRSWLSDLSSRALSFGGSARFFTGSSRRSQVVDLEAGEEIADYFHWLS